MKPVRTFTVIPALPEELEPLRGIAGDLHWAWSHDAIALFRRLDADLWEATGHNPILMLGSIDQARLVELASDPAFLANLQQVADAFAMYKAHESTWFQRAHGGGDGLLVAYFSAEFGLTECLSIFAGGLGILAGDHLKSASDLGIPLVGVGLLYQEGYFRQTLNEAGLQQEYYTQNDFDNLPIERVTDTAGDPIAVEVEFPTGPVKVSVWRAEVGRVSLYLLDTNHPDNSSADRAITRQLYGGDRETRIRQEIVLGIGGVSTLAALGIEPTVFHMNEGHSVFLVLELIRRQMQATGVDFATAREASGGLVFTTHTPVPAGHDYFPPALIERYLGHFAESAGMAVGDLLALGRQNPDDDFEEFCNTVLGLRTADWSNGVSRLHGGVSRSMWRNVWPGLPEAEIPIGSTTNGVHFESWISMELKELYDRYLGPKWREEPAAASVWARAEEIPAAELWRTHERRRDRLVGFARQRLAAQLTHRGSPQNEIDLADVVLDPNALTIGFSRRFATYKRATLLLLDPDRLAEILTNPERPVQIIYAGKAHPQDDAGKRLIQSIIELARRPELRRHVVFVSDYDMAVTRELVQGADIWLNTPVRPLEASGTSGMKAAANGVLNLSTLDGWWDEAYEPDVGWAIGRPDTYRDPEKRDRYEALALYDLLERDVIPLFYDRGVDALPRRWIEQMQRSIARLNAVYNTHRMVQEYTERYYLTAHRRNATLRADDAERGRELSAWRRKVTAAWPQLSVADVAIMESDGALQVNEAVGVEAKVRLGDLDPSDVSVELYCGRIDAQDEIIDGVATPMDLDQRSEDGTWCYTASAVFEESGRAGFTVRILPAHADLMTTKVPGLIAWA